MHIPEWEDAATLLRSVSLVSGPCTPEQAAAYLASAESAAAAAAAAGSNGCNVHTVDDATLVPTLLEDAAVATPDPLLVLIVSNVSLGQGLRAGAINILRPTLMVGLWTVPTSVDLGMVVNQLNVTREYSDVFWQSVILENAAPGKAGAGVQANVPLPLHIQALLGCCCSCVAAWQTEHSTLELSCAFAASWHAAAAMAALLHRSTASCYCCFIRSKQIGTGCMSGAAHAHCWYLLMLAGDAVSSMMAAPYSAAVSANIWAMQCDVGAGLLQETVTEVD